MVRVYRDFGRGLTFDECIDGKDTGAHDNGLNEKLLPGSAATLHNVTIAGADSDNKNVFLHFTTHVVLMGYPRVRVSSSRLEHAVVDGIE